MAEYVKYEKAKGPKLIRLGRYSFSTIEVKHLSVALIMITLTLMVLNITQVDRSNILNIIVIYFFSVGLGFLLHELGHKLVAQYYGFISEFRADFVMLGVAFVMAYVFSFVFLAPGAVMILGRVTRRQNGIISVAGPIVNLSLGIIFILLNMIFNPANGSLFFSMLITGIWVNGFLGVFNMLPFWVLDGKKVLAWNKGVYFSVLIALIFLLISTFNGWVY